MDKESQLFQLYLDMGEGRSLRKLAEATDKSYSYLTKLSASNDWKRQVVEETQLVVDSINAQFVDRRLKQTEAKLSLAERMFKKLEESFDYLEIENPRDFKIILDAYHLISGKPTVISQDVTNLPLDSMTDEEVARLAELLAQASD